MSNGNESDAQVGPIARRSSFADFVTDNPADGCATNGSDRAATGENGATDGTNTGADGRILVLPRHAGTRTQAKQHGCGKRTERKSL
jgi:hypothetical protein